MRVLQLLAVVGLILAVSGTAGAISVANVNLTPSSNLVNVGDMFWLTVDVTSKDATAYTISGISVQLKYDPGKLEYLGFESLLTPVGSLFPPESGWILGALLPGSDTEGLTEHVAYFWLMGESSTLTPADIYRFRFKALDGLTSGGTEVTFNYSKISAPEGIELPADTHGAEAALVPEPVTMAGMLMAVGGLAGYIRRRRTA